MDYATLSRLLGGVIFSDEYRGDLGDIESRCSEEETRLMESASAGDRHSATLLRAVHFIFAGNLRKAQTYLEQLLGEEGLDTRFKARCYAYRFYLDCVKRLPLVLRFRPYSGDSAFFLLDSELRLLDRLKTLENSRQHLTAMEYLESVLLERTLSLSTARQMSFSAHPQHPNIIAQDTALVDPRSLLADISDLSALLHLPTTKLYLDRMDVELHLARDSHESQGMLAKLLLAYESAMDLSGMATCHLMQADRIVSRPFTSPLAMGLICEIKTEGWSNPTWDASEHSFLLHDDKRAQDLYEKSRFLYEAANCPRGQAAVLLRRGCIQHAVAISTLGSQTGTAATRIKAFQEASRSFVRAAELFSGDIVSGMLVRCHQILLAISSRDSGELGSNVMEQGRDLVRASQDLGSDTYDTDNSGAANFMGVLMLRFGRWRFVADRDVRTALACCASARALFAGARESFLELQALLAHASLLHESGKVVRAEMKINEGRGPEGLLASVLERIAKVCDSSDKTNAQRAMRFNTLKGFDLIASRIYQATGNSTRLIEWMRERDQLAPLGTGTAQQEIEDLFGGFSSLALGSSPDHEPAPPARANIINKIMPPILSQDQLVADYNSTMSMVYAALDDAEVAVWQRLLREFVWRLDHAAVAPLGPPSDQIAIYKLIALSQLGASDEARANLPTALPRQFASPTDNPAYDVLEGFMKAHAPPYMAPMLRQQKVDAADRAISYCILARDWVRGAEVMSRVVAALPEFNDPRSVTAGSKTWQTITFIALIYEHNRQPCKALEWYLCALSQLEGLATAADIEARRGCHSSIHSGELFAGLARVCLALEGDLGLSAMNLPQQYGLPGPSWTDQALAFVERGRARALLDFLVMKENLDPKSVTEWAAHAQRTYQGHILTSKIGDSMTYDEVAARLSQHGRRVEIRSDDDVRTALSRLEAEELASSSMFNLADPPPTAEALFKCIAEDIVVFEISSSRQGLIVLAITREGVIASHQSDLTDIQLRSLVLNYTKVVRESVGEAEDQETLQKIAEAISKEILEPLKHTLHNKEAAVFAPSHSMQLFPCAALLLNGTPLFLHKIVYVIPSLSVLSHLVGRCTRRAAPTVTRSTATILASSTAAGAKMSAMELVNDESGEAIPMIGPEAVMIADALNTSPKDLAACSTDELRSILGWSDIVHLATHGTAIFDSPWQSYLDTKPPCFRVLDLAALTDCAARLVVFSCCWSGAGSANPGNDIIGFAHATLASGAQAYIGGLWRTADMASMLLMVLFYREISSRRRQRQKVRLAEAWRSAQIALYYANKEFVQTLLVEAKDLWSDMMQKGETKHVLEQFKHSEKCLNAHLRDYSGKYTDAIVDFKHPVMWAPYALVGNGDVVLD